MISIFDKLSAEIGAADNATKLEHCRQTALFAPLTDDERSAADEMIDRRFAELNARAAVVRNPRWTPRGAAKGAATIAPWPPGAGRPEMN